MIPSPFLRICFRVCAGSLLAGLLIATSLLLYPPTANSLPGHVLAWAAAFFAGLSLVLPPLDAPDSEALARHPTPRAAKERARQQDPVPVISPTLPVHPSVTLDHAAALRFIREHPKCALATTEGNQPHVRTVWAWAPNDEGLYFVLPGRRGAAAELAHNARTEACFCAPGTTHSEIEELRIRGRLSPVDQTRRLPEEEWVPSRWPETSEAADPSLLFYRLEDGEAQFCTTRIETEFHPRTTVANP